MSALGDQWAFFHTRPLSDEVVELRHGVRVPVRFEAVALDDVAIAVSIEMCGTEAVCRSLHLYPFERGGELVVDRVTPKQLASLNLAELIEAAVEDAAIWATFKIVTHDRLGRTEQVRLSESDLVSISGAMRRRRTITPEFLAEVARVYRAGGRAPAKAVAEHFGYEAGDSTPARWIRLARRNGHLEA